MERLQKQISKCGITSRRKAEELIVSGKVKVNGILVTKLGTKVSKSDIIEVNGKIIEEKDLVYYVINKPRGVICTVNDPEKRKTILTILPEKLKQMRIFPVGRLDSDTKGVLLLTNDGEFMNEMVGPKSGIEKEYLARVEGIVTLNDLKKLSNGIILDGKKTLPAIVNIESKDLENNSSLIRIIVTEGRYHLIKKMCDACNHPVKKLTRVRFGHITIDNLEEGKAVRIPPHDIKLLRLAAKKAKILK